jgi:hypothetical protein
VIDTLKLSRKLYQAGMDREVAEAVSEGLAEAITTNAATKDDLKAQEDRLDARIDGAKERLTLRLNAFEERVEARLRTLEERFLARLESAHWRTLAAVAAMLLANVVVTWRLVGG